MSRAEGNPKPQYAGMSPEEKKSAYWKNSYEKHKDKRQAEGRAQAKKYRVEHKEEVLKKKLNQWLRDVFKKSTEWYEETLKSQDGHCALCPTEPSGRRLQVDHDHKCCPSRREGTRKTCGECVRGLLCEACNTRLGHLEIFMSEALVIPKAGTIKTLGQPETWTTRALRYIAQYE